VRIDLVRFTDRDQWLADEFWCDVDIQVHMIASQLGYQVDEGVIEQMVLEAWLEFADVSGTA
jgi:hypothetical protein